MMLRRLPLLLLLVVCSVSHGRLVARESEKLETVARGGERYVSLQKWARAKGFTIAWDPGSRDLQVTNNWANLGFTINSKRSSINGLEVWLCSSVVTNGSTLYITERDIFKTIHPILYPSKTGKKIHTIVIAAGHGGKDPGYQLDAQQEKKYTLLMSKILKETLESAGFKVIMTRNSDEFVDLEEQAQIANRAKADLFIAVHYNSAQIVEAKGVETYSLTPEGAISTNGGTPMPKSPGHKNDLLNILLAQQVQKSLLQNTEFADRGIRRAGFMMLREIKMPGVLIEGGFLSNPFDAQKIYHPVYRRKVARAITDGVLAYARLVERK